MAWLELLFRGVLLSSHWPLKQNPWEGLHPGVEVAWAGPLVEALSLRAASTWVSHLGFGSGLVPQFRYLMCLTL